MSDKDLKPEQKSEEIDLGQLLKVIGDMFRCLIDFIGSVLEKLFGLVLLFLIALRKHFLKLLVLLIIGFVIGYVLDKNKEPVYGANLVVEPNFGSAKQLYNNISYYNALVKDNDTVQLAQIFNITEKQASYLEGFYIQPLDNENQKVQRYSAIVKQLDTITLKNLSYEEYKRNVEPTDFLFHQIGIASLDKSIYRKLQPIIINSISENQYFKQKKEVTLRNLKLNDSILNVSIRESDSLKQELLRLKSIEASRSSSEGTSIVMADSPESNAEIIRLLQRKLDLKDELSINRINQVENEEIIKVISDFPAEGYLERNFLSEYKFIIPVALLSLYLVIVILIQMNSYLLRKEKDLKQQL